MRRRLHGEEGGSFYYLLIASYDYRLQGRQGTVKRTFYYLLIASEEKERQRHGFEQLVFLLSLDCFNIPCLPSVLLYRGEIFLLSLDCFLPRLPEKFGKVEVLTFYYLLIAS